MIGGDRIEGDGNLEEIERVGINRGSRVRVVTSHESQESHEKVDISRERVDIKVDGPRVLGTGGSQRDKTSKSGLSQSR